MLNLEENMKNTYRACAEINLDALKHNIQEIQAVLGDTKLMCVIKTNAYGHGSIVLARELAAMGAYGFAVATVDEGIELRNNGIIQPILVLRFCCQRTVCRYDHPSYHACYFYIQHGQRF